jgi:hypothetical protein
VITSPEKEKRSVTHYFCDLARTFFHEPCAKAPVLCVCVCACVRVCACVCREVFYTSIHAPWTEYKYKRAHTHTWSTWSLKLSRERPNTFHVDRTLSRYLVDVVTNVVPTLQVRVPLHVSYFTHTHTHIYTYNIYIYI